MDTQKWEGEVKYEYEHDKMTHNVKYNKATKRYKQPTSSHLQYQT